MVTSSCRHSESSAGGYTVDPLFKLPNSRAEDPRYRVRAVSRLRLECLVMAAVDRRVSFTDPALHAPDLLQANRLLAAVQQPSVPAFHECAF